MNTDDSRAAVYLRLLPLPVRAGQEATFTRFYQDSVLPALEATEGCLYAALLAPWRSESYQSLTVWSSPERAAAYEHAGDYLSLLAEAAPLLAEGARWRVSPPVDPLETAGGEPRRELPTDGYLVDDAALAALAATGGGSFVRIVTVRLALDRNDEFAALYRGSVVPALERVDGCRAIFLAVAIDDPQQVLSITLWDREEEAVRYEMSREFEHLAAGLAATFAPATGWRAAPGGAGATSRLEVTSYQVVRGRSLGPSGGHPG
jgi:heme-degrading monooxygenase HmoA